MRPRFSIRLLLFSVAAVAFACYFCFVRPVLIAKQFRQAMAANDFSKAESLGGNQSNRFLTELIDDGRTYRVEVEIFRRKSRDIWKLQQPMLVRLIPESPRPDSTMLVGYQLDVLATPMGIKPGNPYPVTFRR